MKPYRIQRKRTKGWRMPEGAVYVGRPARWGNSFIAGRSGPWPRDVAVSNFRGWLEALFWMAANGSQDAAVGLYDYLIPLRGHDLACWCPLCEAHADGLPLGVECPDCAPCHAAVLLELANA